MSKSLAASPLQSEVDEARSLLDSAERGKKQADLELADARTSVNDMNTINSKALSDKRCLESAIHIMHAELDDMLHQVQNFAIYSLILMIHSWLQPVRKRLDHSFFTLVV